MKENYYERDVILAENQGVHFDYVFQSRLILDLVRMVVGHTWDLGALRKCYVQYPPFSSVWKSNLPEFFPLKVYKAL